MYHFYSFVAPGSTTQSSGPWSLISCEDNSNMMLYKEIATTALQSAKAGVLPTSDLFGDGKATQIQFCLFLPEFWDPKNGGFEWILFSTYWALLQVDKMIQESLWAYNR